MHLSPPNRLHPDKGIALGPILFIIAILAILAAAIAAGSGGFSGSTNTDSAKTLGQAIINYGNQLTDAVTKVTSSGCSASQVSFDSPTWPTPLSWWSYANSNAPSDHSCHVFYPNGGGLLIGSLPSGSYDTSITTSALFQSFPNKYGVWQFPETMCVWGIGGYDANQSNCNTVGPQSIIAVAPFLTRDVCIQINTILGITNPSGVPPSYGVAVNFNTWHGGTSGYPFSLGSGTVFSGKTAGCFRDTNASSIGVNGYFYYQVLLAGVSARP